MAFSPIANPVYSYLPAPGNSTYPQLPGYAMASLPPTVLVFQQLLANLLQSVSQLAQNWSSLLQPPQAPAVRLPQPDSYLPPDTVYGWPQQLRGFTGSHRVGEAPPGYQWNRELIQRVPGDGNPGEPYRHFLSPVGVPGVEMRQVAPGQYIPLLNSSKYPPLPPDTRVRYGRDEKVPPAPKGYQWVNRYPFSTELTPRGLPDVNLFYSEFGWVATKRHEQPNA